MCQFKSAIVTKKGIIWEIGNNNHSILLENSGLKDDGVRNNFVRVEMLPRDNIFNHKKSNWYLHVDQDNIPTWFDEKEISERMWKQVMKEVFKEQFVIDKNDITKENVNGLWIKNSKNIIVKNCQTVEVFDNSTVEVFDNSTVEVFDNSTVKVFDNSTVKAFDNSTVKAFDNSTVEVSGNSQILLPYSHNVKIIKVSGNALVKDVPNKKIIVANKDFKKIIFKRS
ncbi:MAG TPA: hypothetical protein ENI08_00770 [Candidatus Dependentiae bacterium]|nr:hypothetical protein [Candidatus Dependentiae bacterium]